MIALQLGQPEQRKRRTARRSVIGPPGAVSPMPVTVPGAISPMPATVPGAMSPVPSTIFVDFLDTARAIGERLYVINAMQSSPLPIGRYAPVSQLTDNWATTDAADERLKVYRRWITLRGGTFADGDYAGRLIWAYQRGFPDASAEQIFTAGDLCLQLLRWTKVNYPDAPPELVCDVMLTMLGGFEVTEEDLIIPTEEEKEEKGDNKLLVAIIAIGFLVLIWR